jgi:type IV pilus assembly protein PilN
MLVEINLLPKKERRKSATIAISAIFLIILLITAVFFYWRTQTIKDEINTLTRELKQTQQLTAIEQEKLLSFEANDSVEQLESSINWANEYPILSVPVMRLLTALLPERGFIQSFNYEEIGTITLMVQFDTSREAAYFLDRLNVSKWIQEVDLNTLNAVDESSTTETDGLTTSTTTTVEEENTFLPRYVGEFEIKLDREIVKKASEESTKEADKGVDET